MAIAFTEKEEEVLMRGNCLGWPIFLTARGKSLPGAVPPKDENIALALIVSHSSFSLANQVGRAIKSSERLKLRL